MIRAECTNHRVTRGLRAHHRLLPAAALLRRSLFLGDLPLLCRLPLRYGFPFRCGLFSFCHFVSPPFVRIFFCVRLIHNEYSTEMHVRATVHDIFFIVSRDRSCIVVRYRSIL